MSSLLVLDLLGGSVYALSRAALAVQQRLDVFGVLFLWKDRQAPSRLDTA